MTDSTEQFNNFRNQYFATIVGNIIVFSFGSIIGWFSPVLPLLLSDKTPLASGPLTLSEASWIGSIYPVFAGIGSAINGYLIPRIGVRRIMIMMCFPMISIWICIIYATSSLLLILSRIILGLFCIGCEQCVVLFISDIADHRIRGTLCSFQLLSRSLGYLAAFIVGAFVEYSITPYIFIGLPVVFFAVFSFIPNSPKFLVQNGKLDEARASMRYYKNVDDKSSKINEAIEMELQRLQSVMAEDQKKKKLTKKDLKNPRIYRGLIIGIVLATINQFSGLFTFLTYGVRIFEESGTQIDAQHANITLGVFQVIGNLSTTQLADRIGRRLLLIISVAGSALGLFSMALYNYLDLNGFNLTAVSWIPVASLVFVVFISSVGIIPLTLICVVETLPAEAVQLGLASTMVTICGTSFLTTKLFPILSTSIHLYGCMLIFGIISSLGVVFIYFYVKETNGIDLNALNETKTEV